MSLRAFDTLWQCGGQEIGRQIIEAEDMDAALVSAWIRMPAISRSGHKPCDMIRITDMISGKELVEDVPPFSPPPVRIAKAISILVLGCVGLLLGIWMARHGQYASRGDRRLLMDCLMTLPLAFVFAVIAGAMSYKERQGAIAQWKKDFGDLRPAVGPDNPRLARVIVARFSVWREGLRLLLGLAAIIAGICIPLASRLSGDHWEWWQPVVWAASAALFFAYLPPLRQFLFDAGPRFGSRAANWCTATAWRSRSRSGASGASRWRSTSRRGALPMMSSCSPARLAIAPLLRVQASFPNPPKKLRHVSTACCRWSHSFVPSFPD